MTPAIIGLILATAVLIGRDCAYAGETAAFLKINPGARPMAMGEAFTAVADDLNALATNPSGLSRLSTRQAAFMHAELFADTRYDFVGFAQPLARHRGALGVAVQHLSSARISGRDANRNATGSFGASDTAVSLAYSRSLLWSTLGGINLKFIESRLADASARTVAADLGVMRSMSVAGLPVSLGAAARNLGPGLRYSSEMNPLPLSLSVGATLGLAGMLFSADLNHHPHSGQLSAGVGTEYAVLPTLALRTGYMAPGAFQGSSGLAAGLNGLGMGFGLKIKKFSVDYSFSPYGDLGNAQRISLSSRF